MANIRAYQDKVLKTLSGKIAGFYLGGGTALSVYYFNHRESVDLDFFTQDFSKTGVVEITDYLTEKLKYKIELLAEEARKNRIKMLVYSLYMSKSVTLKIDFVQDYLKLIKPAKLINGINVMPIEDIYLRKIYAITGSMQIEDITGRRVSMDGRQEAKDYYDLYCLSQIFMRLSDFAYRYGNQIIRESLIRWFSTYSRLDIKTGLLELSLKKKIDYPEIERHFKKEINSITEKEVGSV